ncbi:MAG: DUF4129 domain-containing protein [Actinomycetota bacterium]
MEIERISLRLRRRTPWEALDLGHTMLRAWAGPAYRAWLGTYWVVGLILLGICWTRQEIAFLILWWLKPLFDRVLLFAFSRSLFDAPTTFRDVIKALPALVKKTSLLSGLTFRRLSMARSFLLPVWQLEEQHGKAARTRFKVLCRRTRGNAVWLTFVCANLSTVIWVSLVVIMGALTPQGGGDSLSVFHWFKDDLTPAQDFIISLLFLVAESIVEPFYIASGFALYLNRRSELEGWDIELAFRRLAHRVEAAAKAVPGLTAALVLAVAVALTPTPAEAAPPPNAASPAKQTIEKILTDPVFGHKSEEMKWRWRQDDKPNPEAKPPNWIATLLRFLEFSSQVMKGLVWIGALLLAAGLVYLIIRYREKLLGSKEVRPPPPDFLFGLDVRPESLPDDIAAAARAAIAAGQVEKALSLLYRGALVALIHRVRVELQPGDTENDCQRRVDGRLEPAADRYFGLLLQVWRSTAYAGQVPPPPLLESLCQDWGQHFGLTPAGKAP